MMMYDKEDVRYIVEEFLARYLNLDSLSLNGHLVYELYEILNRYGIEVENIQRQWLIK